MTRLTEAEPPNLDFDQPMRLEVVALHQDDDGRTVLTYAYGPDVDGGDPPGVGGAAGVTTVEVAGVGLHPFGRFPDTSAHRSGGGGGAQRHGGRRVGPRGFEAAFCGTAYGGVATGHKVLGRAGIDRHAHRRRGGRMRQRRRRRSCWRPAPSGPASTHGAGVRGREDAQGDHPLVVLRALAGGGRLRGDPAYFALRAQRLMRDTGVTKEQLAAVVVKNRRHGAHNPDAMFRSEVTPPRCSDRGWCASRCTCGCCARPTRARPRWC